MTGDIDLTKLNLQGPSKFNRKHWPWRSCNGKVSVSRTRIFVSLHQGATPTVKRRSWYEQKKYQV